MRRLAPIVVLFALVACRPQPPSPTLTEAGTPLKVVASSSKECQSEQGWEQVNCVRASFPGGRAFAVSQRRFESGAIPLWKIVIRGDRTLEATGPPDTWSTIMLLTERLGEPALFVGYRYAGPGNVIDYDVLRWPRSGRLHVVLHREGIRHGVMVFDNDRIVEYAADYPNNEDDCCPPRYRRTVIDPAPRVVRDTYVKPSDVPG